MMCPAMRQDGLMGKVPCVAEQAKYEGQIVKTALTCLYCGKPLLGFPKPNIQAKRLPEFTMDDRYMRCLPPAKPKDNWPPNLIGCGGYGEVSQNHPHAGVQLTPDPADGFLCNLCHGTGFIRKKDIYG